MSLGLLIRLLVCVFVLGGCLYIYIDKQNDLTELKMELPSLSKEVRKIEEENAHFTLKIEQLENPSRLLELLREKEFSHLRYPCAHDVIIIEEQKL